MKATFLKERLEKSTSIELDNSTKIKELEQEEVYKYLGVNVSNGIKNTTIKEKIKNECYWRVRAILKIELNSANQIQPINTLAIPVDKKDKKMDTKICEL